jgi:hypothetical protein
MSEEVKPGQESALHQVVSESRLPVESLATVAADQPTAIETENLNRIFLPFALEQAERTQQQQRRFVHYTSAENALNIIKNKQIWLRNVRCMSDYMEVLYGHELLRNFFSNEQHRKTFHDALDPCAAGVAGEAIRLFDQWWLDIQFNTYISCLSEHEDDEDNHGRLSMWRAFGRLSARAALVLNLAKNNAAAGIPVMFSPVAYFNYQRLETEIHRVISNIITNTEVLRRIDKQIILNHIFYMLMAATVSLKHEGFKEEKEWRLIYSPQMRPSPLMLRSVEVIEGIPQIIYKIDLENRPSDNIGGITIPELVHRIIIGPSPFPFTIRDAFVAVLQEAGMSDAEARSRVVASGIPLRT